MQAEVAQAVPAAVNAATGLGGQVVLVLLTLISTAAMLFKTTRDQKHALDVIKLQADLAAADRREKSQAEQHDRELKQADIRERLLIERAHTLSSLQQVTNLTAAHVETSTQAVKDDTQRVAALQTIELKAAIDAAHRQMAAAAKVAYDEANDVNTKLRKLNEAHEKQGVVLEQLLKTVMAQALPAGVARKEVGQ